MAQQLESDVSSAYLESVRSQRVREAKDRIRQNQAQREVDVIPADKIIPPEPQDIEKPLEPADARMSFSIGADLALGLGVESPTQLLGGAIDVPNQAIENLEELANIVNEIIQPEIDEELDSLVAEAIPDIDAAREFFPAIDLLAGAGILDVSADEEEKIKFPRVPTTPPARSRTGEFIRQMTKTLISVVIGGKGFQLGTQAVGEGLKKATKGKVGQKLAKKKLSLAAKATGGSAVAAGTLQDLEKGSEGVAKLLTEDAGIQNSILEWLAEPDPKKAAIIETGLKRAVGDVLDTATAAGFLKGLKTVRDVGIKAKKAFDQSKLGKARQERRQRRAEERAAKGNLRNKLSQESVDTLGDPASGKFFFSSRDAEKQFNAFFRLKEGLKEFAAVSDVVLRDGKYLINYSKINTTEELQELFDQVTKLEARAIGKDPTLKRKPGGQAKFEAEDEFPTFTDFLGFQGKGPFSDAQVRASKALIVSSARQVRVYAGKALSPSGTDSDKIVARRALGVHAAMVKLFKEKRTEAGRTLQAYSAIKGDDLDLALKMDAFIDEAGGADALDDMSKIIFFSANARALSNSADDMVASTWGRAIETYVLVNWLSGTKTAVKNITGNSSAAVWFPVEKMAAAVHSNIFGDRSIKYGESVATAYGMLKGIRGGLALAFRAEKAQGIGHRAEKFRRTQKVEGVTGNAINSTLLESGGDSLLGHGLNFIGHIYAQPTKILLERPDMFFKNVIYTGEIEALAYNQVKSEGLFGAAAKTRMKELTEHPPKEMDYDSFSMAEELTFVKKVGGIGQDLKRALRAPEIKYVGWAINPFINTRINLWKYKFERTPLAFASQKVQADLSAGGRRRSLALGKIGATSTLLMACVDMAVDGLITGDGPKDKGLNQNWREGGKKPSAFKYGDTYIPVDGLDPMGGFVRQCGRLGEIINNVDESVAAELVTATILSYYDLLNPEQFIGGVGSFLGFMGDSNYDQDIESSLLNFATSAGLPLSGFFRGQAQASDPVRKLKRRKLTKEERQLPGLDLEINTFLDNLYTQAQSQYWFTAENVPPFHNKYGEPISTASGLGFGYDMAGPASLGKVTDDPVKKFMEEHEVAFDNVELNFGGVSLTLHQASWYQKIAGESLMADLKQLIKNPGFQAATDGVNGKKTTLVKSLAARHRKAAREKLKKMFPDLQRRIWDFEEKDIKDQTGVDVNIGQRIAPPVPLVSDSEDQGNSLIDQLGGKR